MSEGRQRLEWSRTCELLAMIYNRTRFDKKEKVIRARDINPFYEKPNPPIVGIGILKDVFIRSPGTKPIRR